jgi:hypothetical protein
MEIDYGYISIIVCAIIGLITWHRNREMYLKVLPVFLLLDFTIESIGWWLSSRHESNILLYSIFNVLALNFYLFILYNVLRTTMAKKVVTIVMIFFSLFAIGNFVFYQGLEEYHSLTYSVGSLCIVAVSAYYFLELFQFPRSITLMREPGFWISSGLIFFFSCGFPFFGSINIMNALPKLLLNNLEILLNILNILLYTLFSIAFLCRNNTRKSTRL